MTSCHRRETVICPHCSASSSRQFAERTDTPPSLDEELAAWLRRASASNGFGAPEAAREPPAQPGGSGTNM